MPNLKFTGLAAVAAGAALAGPAQASDPVASFKDWSVVCDNLRNCVANGFAADEIEKPAILEIRRGGAPGDAAKATITLQDGEAATKRGEALVLAVDDRPVLTIKAGDDDTAALVDAQVGPLLGAARNGTTLSVRRGERELGVVSLAGMVAALRLVDDQQKRGGTVTALVAKGAKPASAVPPPPAPPVIRAAPAVAQTGLAAKPPAPVKALSTKAECDVYEGENSTGEPTAHRLSADLVLWLMPCGAGAYNYTSYLVVADNKGSGARIAPGLGDGMLVNAGYDPKTRILSSYAKGRGIGDCGDSSEWAWTGRTFELSGGASMPLCRGQTDWPVSFRAKVE